MLKKRIITSLCGIPVLIAAIWFNAPLHWFTVLVAILGVLTAYEFYRLISASKATTFIYSGIFSTLLFIILRDTGLQTAMEPFIETRLLLALIPCGLLAILLESYAWPAMFPDSKKKITFLSGAWTVIGAVYVGWLLGHLVALRGFDDGRNWVFLALFATFAYDTAAYFTGISIGRHKMAPQISPGKTWEGAAGGAAGAVLLSLFFTLDTPLGLPISWGQAVIIGLLVSFFGQAGDLIESAFKRYTNVKDSGSTLPGHGGFLDRLDSIVFSGLVVYYYVIWVIQ